jgi:Peptidase family M28
MYRSAFFLLLMASPLAAQAPNQSLEAAAGTITDADVMRRVHIIAHDSMMGRNTPSRGLELTAQYVANEFKRFGLKPGGENGSWLQRYNITRSRLDPAGSHVGFMLGGSHMHAELSRDARYLFGGVPEREIGGPAVLIGGTYDSTRSLTGVKDRVALVVLDRSGGPMSLNGTRVIRALTAAGAKGVVIISNRDSAMFASELRRQGNVRLSIEGTAGPRVPVVEVHERALGQVLRGAGIQPGELRSNPAWVARPLAGLTVMIDLKQEILERASAPNTIGILEGTDPRLRNEYVVFSAHMDHIGVTSGRPDSINNGADDDASGTVGIVELAEAFSQARPRRSLLFITVSGEEHGLWGSQHFAEHPTVPVGSMVANLNMDMIGRNWKDTIVAIGKEHSDLGATLNRVNQAHPELRMTAIDDRWPQENFYSRSDHYNFARKGVPVLFFFNGTHDDYHRPSDSPDKIDGEKEARILQLVFYLGQDVANAPNRPRWNPESYRRIVEGAGTR